MAMKRKASKILIWLTALVLLVAFKVLPVSAVEYTIEEELIANDLEIAFPVSENVEIVKNFKDEVSTVGLTGDEILLYANGEIQTINEEDGTGQESVLNYGTVSGYLSDTGDYELYSLNLSAGDYLLARLAVPNNDTINYALVLYDSELNVIKMSHYIPYLNEEKTLEESIGYLAASDELVYVGIFSLVGGSETESYTLDFSVTTNFSSLSDTGEPNENAQEATALTLGSAGTSVSGKLNSPIDNDWYSFTVLDSPRYNRMRLNLTSTSSANGCRMEIYRNVTEDYFAMQLGGSGAGEGEIELPAGTYYIRVVSTNTINDFDLGNLPAYNLSVVPVSRVDGIMITNYQGPAGNADGTPYPEGSSYLLYNSQPNWINIVGLAYYTDSMGNKTGSANVKLRVKVVNTSWEAYNRPDLATTYETTVTRDNGYFYRTVSVNEAVGLHYYRGDSYDVMQVEICLVYAPERKINDIFFLLDKY